MTSSSPSPTRTPPPPQIRLHPTTIWVLEQTLSDERQHIRVGHELEAEIEPPEPGLARDLLRGHPIPHGIAGTLQPATPTTRPRRAIRGTVQQILAVTTIYRPDATGSWTPIPGAARLRPADSTCQPDTTRSVWICSGNPALTGFLITLLPGAPLPH